MKRLLEENKTLTQIVNEQFWISRSSEGQGHDTTCCWKGLDLSNNVCEYELNRLTNEKNIRGQRNFNANDAANPSDRPVSPIDKTIFFPQQIW